MGRVDGGQSALTLLFGKVFFVLLPLALFPAVLSSQVVPDRPAKAEKQPSPRDEVRRLVAEGKLKAAAEKLEQIRGREGASPELLGELAKLYRWQGENSALLDTLSALAALAPPTPELDNEIVILATDAGRLETAVASYRRMISRAPGDAALRDRYLDFLLWKGLKTLAEEEIRERLARQPSADLRRRLVRLLADSGRRAEIVLEHLRWIDGAPRDRDLLEEASGDFLAHGFTKAAIVINRRLAALDPENPLPRRRVVQFFLWAGIMERALPELLWFADHEPRDAETAKLLAQAHASLKRVKDTVRWAEKAVDLDPGDTGNREYLAQVLIWANRPFDAIRHYLLLLQEDPRHYRAHFVVGDLLYWENRRGVALDHLRQALNILRALPPEEAEKKEPRLILARTLVRLGYFPEAAAEAEKLVRRFPEDREAKLRLAEVYYWTGWYEAAIAVLRPLAARHPEDEEIRRFIAACLVRNNEPSEAGPIYEGLLTGDRDDKGLLLDQTAVRLAAGRADLALPLFRRVLELDPDKREAALGIGYVSSLLSDEGSLFLRYEQASTSLGITSLTAAYRMLFPPAFTLAASRERLTVKRDELPFAEKIDHESSLNTFSAGYEAKPFWKAEGSIGFYEGPTHLNPAWAGRLTFRPSGENLLAVGYRHHLLWYDPETYLSEEGYRNRWEGQLSWEAVRPITLSGFFATEEIFLPGREHERYGRGTEAYSQAALHLSRAPRFDLWYRLRYFTFDYEKAYASDVDAVFHDREITHYLSAIYECNRLSSLRLQLQETISYDTDNEKWGSASGVYAVYSPSGRDWLEGGAVYIVSREGDAPKEWRWITTLNYRRAF